MTDPRRPFTPDERKTLAELPSPRSPFHLLWDTAMGSIGATGCLGAMATLALVAILGTFNAKPIAHTLVIATVSVLVVIISTISTSLRYSIARRKELDWRSKVDADLAGGQATVERHHATAALRAIMEEQRERAYFMRLKDGRAMFIGFWNPADDDNPAGIESMPADLDSYPALEFEIARSPESRILLGVKFVGPPLPVSSTFELRQGPGTPPLNIGDIVPMPWEQIEKTYG